MSKALFLESVAGVAGDMFAAAFLDAGLVTIEELNSLTGLLGMDGVSVQAERVTRATTTATHLDVSWQDERWKLQFSSSAHQHPHHDDSTNLLLGDDAATRWHTRYKDVESLIARSSLDASTKDISLSIFRLLAEAEANAHGIVIEDVAFHEVGTIDSIMDVVMAAYCVARLGADQIYATPIKAGRGTVTMTHGTHPVPPPASIRLLIGLPIAKTPDTITRENVELSTPTGIAILKALSPIFVEELPAGILLGQGTGAGTMDLGSFPNVFRVSVLETNSAKAELPYEKDSVTEIVCNIDDDTGEHLAWMTQQLLEMGALDVWQTAATGKKGRVLVCLSILASDETWKKFADWILRNSTTFGLRHRKWDRLKLARTFETRESSKGDVTYKIGSTIDGDLLKEKPEHDDVVKQDIDVEGLIF